jgi:hypothetical protein
MLKKMFMKLLESEISIFDPFTQIPQVGLQYSPVRR